MKTGKCGKNSQRNKHASKFMFSFKIAPSASYIYARFLPFSFFVHWMEQSSCGCALENLESSSTKIMMSGPSARQLCEGNKGETRIDLDDEFQWLIA